MSDSSDSDGYSSRILSNKKSDENFVSSKNNFIKELQNHSNMCDVAQNAFLKANESFVNVKRGSKPKKINFSLNAEELGISNGKFDDCQEQSNSKTISKKRKSLLDEPDELTEEQEGLYKKHKKSKHRSRDKSELDSSVREVDASSSKEEKKLKKKKKDLIVTSTQKDRDDLSVEDLNNTVGSLLDFEQKNLSIKNITAEGSEDEFNIDKLLEIEELKLQTKPNKESKKKNKGRSESESSTKKHKSKEDILGTFEKRNSLKKIKFECDSLHNLEENRPCFILQVPVEVDPHQLKGKTVSLNNKSKIKIDDIDYVASPGEDECSLTVLGENNQHLRLEVSHCVKMKLSSKAGTSKPSRTPVTSEENDIINSLLSEKVNCINSADKQRKAKLEKSPSKIINKKNKMDQLDKFLKEGTKFLEDVNFISFRFKNEKLVADLDRQTNLVLEKQVEFLQKQNASSAEYQKMKKDLAVQTRELLQKRMDVMKNKKVGSDGELSDYF